ncbi:RNA-directed DNA polymerase [Cohnella abietis]|uniref:Reverse transcriptase n=1 Tax=Cohnella abietis TaxID=2507935 RepID=A0A3T1D5T3_9BACL|nr:RNA-directed DNA polymerase [Cohnella abietis]BBI33461.1 reverse transcriptase [Cohnella abietis]
MSVVIGIAEKIISQGYFPKEIPKEFTSLDIGGHVNTFDLSKEKLTKKGLNKWSKLIDFSYPKTDNFRRTISVAHPLHYILLARLLEENWDKLNDHFNKSQYSLTTPSVYDSEPIKPKFKMEEKINRRLTNLVTRKYILKADITRYYPSIYTHSIPWALHTKEVAKSNTKDDNLIGNKIDTLVRNMQDGQTIGIPIGPVTSLIIQEIVGTAIDNEFMREIGDSLRGFRYTDDMEYYFSSSEEAEKALNVLHKVLQRYELVLNKEKTVIIKIPQGLEPEWLYYFRKFKFRYTKDNKQIATVVQRDDLKEYFGKAFKFKIETSEKGILNYAIKNLRKIIINRENWDLFESLVLQSILVDSSIIPTVFEIIEGYKYRGYPINMDKLTDFINALIKDNIELKNEFEVSWALSFASKLNIRIVEDASNLLLKNDNALINILVMILHSKELLDGSLDFSFYESLLTQESLYESSWLFTYECCIQGWIGRDKNTDFIKDDKFFEQLSRYNISFINPNYSIVLEYLKKSMISICMDQYKSKVTVLSAKEILLEVIEEYAFSFDNGLFEEILNLLELNIKEEIEENQEAEEEIEENQEAEEEIEENQEAEEEIEENQEAEEEIEENQEADEEIEEDQEAGEGVEESWISNFLTTNINKTLRIRTFKSERDY